MDKPVLYKLVFLRITIFMKQHFDIWLIFLTHFWRPKDVKGLWIRELRMLIHELYKVCYQWFP